MAAGFQNNAFQGFQVVATTTVITPAGLVTLFAFVDPETAMNWVEVEYWFSIKLPDAETFFTLESLATEFVITIPDATTSFRI